jgi:hypothetical protein
MALNSYCIKKAVGVVVKVLNLTVKRTFSSLLRVKTHGSLKIYVPL